MRPAVGRSRRKVPPHPRGWSRCDGRRDQWAGGSPAPAGMVPISPSRLKASRRFPRTRGDGPGPIRDGGRLGAVPPHPRGWSPIANLVCSRSTGSPAPAGMVPIASAHRSGTVRFPRTRGDGPWWDAVGDGQEKVPPHPRGWSQYWHACRECLRGSPAPAGMVPLAHRPSKSPMRFPRTRGDGPDLQGQSERDHWVPPHPRGWSRDGAPAPHRGSGSPAPAGMVPVRAACRARRRGFPRTRGDGPKRADRAEPALGVPPHPRGWSPPRRSRPSRPAGSPAPAGMVPRSRAAIRVFSGFPRTRGDGPDTGLPIDKLFVVPPHPRGWSPP